MMHFRFLHLSFVLTAALNPLCAWAKTNTWYFTGTMVEDAPYNKTIASPNKSELLLQSKNSSNTNSTSNAIGYKAVLGYQLHRNFSVEGAYVDMAAPSTGLNISALALVPVNYQLSMFGKLGYTLGTLDHVGTSGITGMRLNQEKSSPGIGFGGTYSINKTADLRAEWEKLYENLNLLSLGLQLKF